MQNKDSKNILITGGAGFIGSNVLQYLFNKYPSYYFIVLDTLTYAGDIRNISSQIKESKNFQFWYGDIRNAKLVDHLVSQVDMVLHFAAETHVARSIYDDALFFETDVLGTHCITNAILRHRKNIDRFIHISTSEVYGTALSATIDEEHPLNPQSPYAAAKVGADRLVYSYMTTYKIPATIIRPFNIFGPHQHLEKLIPRFITSCILKESLTIHGSGESRRDFTYVNDLAYAIDLVMHAPREKVEREIFNVGIGKDYSVNEIAQMIIASMTAEYNIQHTLYTLNIGDRPGQVFRHTANAKKIQKVLGWEPQKTFKDGLNDTIQWYCANQEWWKDKIWMRCVPIETEDGKKELH